MMMLLVAACQKPAQHTEPLCCVPPPTQTTTKSGAPGAVSETSLYQMAGTWQTARGGALSLDQLQGKVQVFSMIFTHCGYACPKTIANLKAIEAQLPTDIRDRVGFVLVTFDTVRDSTARLRAFADQHGLDQHWKLLRGTESETRMLSLLLNVQYARLTSGDYSHSNVLVVLDEKGQIQARIEGLDLDTESAANQIAAVVN